MSGGGALYYPSYGVAVTRPKISTFQLKMARRAMNFTSSFVAHPLLYTFIVTNNSIMSTLKLTQIIFNLFLASCSLFPSSMYRKASFLANRRTSQLIQDVRMQLSSKTAWFRIYWKL